MKRIFLVLLVLTNLQMMAQEKIQPLVTVMGEGTVKVIPDEVTIHVSVETQGKKALDVKTENDKAVDAVVQYLKNQAIASKDVQTQQVRLNKNYDYNTKTYSYNATQSITILLKDISTYDKIIAGLMDSGINRIDGINFGSSKMEALKSEARQNAIRDAKMKATEYSGVLNQMVGKAVQITELGQIAPMPIQRYKMMEMAQADGNLGGGETLAVGEMTIKAQINVSFELL